MTTSGNHWMEDFIVQITDLIKQNFSSEVIFCAIMMIMGVYVLGRKVGIFPYIHFWVAKDKHNPFKPTQIIHQEPVKPTGQCQDSACHNQVVNTAEKLEELNQLVRQTMIPRMDKTAADVAYIKGRIDGLRTNVQS